MCGAKHPHPFPCLGALLLGLARTGVLYFYMFIPGFPPYIHVHHHEQIPLHHLHLDAASKSLCGA